MERTRINYQKFCGVDQENDLIINNNIWFRKGESLFFPSEDCTVELEREEVKIPTP